jgi:hypothetical protein
VSCRAQIIRSECFVELETSRRRRTRNALDDLANALLDNPRPLPLVQPTRLRKGNEAVKLGENVGDGGELGGEAEEVLQESVDCEQRRLVRERGKRKGARELTNLDLLICGQSKGVNELRREGDGTAQEGSRKKEKRRTSDEATQVSHVLVEVVALLALEVRTHLGHELYVESQRTFSSIIRRRSKRKKPTMTHLKVPPNLTILPRIRHFRLISDRDQVSQLRKIDEREFFDFERGREGG